MIKDILDLVQHNNRVILPNFGAFIISKENGFSVLFNNFLSFNDGLLVNHIAQSQGIDNNQALEKVNAYVESIKNELDNSGKYEIPGLGRFTKDSSGILRFIQDSDNLVKPAETSSSENSGELLDIVPASEATDAPIVPETSLPPTHQNNDSLLNIDNEPEKPAPAKAQPKPEAVIKPQPATSTPTNSQTGNNDMNKKRLSLILIIVLLLLISGAIYFFGWVHPIDFKNFSFFKKKPVETTIVTPTPAPEPAKVIETPAPAPTEFVSDKKFHIIVATLKSEEQANEQVNKLKVKGFSNAMVIPRSGKFLVSIDAESDLISADARQEEIVNQYRIESYVLTLK